MKQERLDMVVPAWLKQALKVSARERGVTLSEFVKDILKQAVRQDPQREMISLFRDQDSIAARNRLAVEPPIIKPPAVAATEQKEVALEPWELILKTVLDEINAGRFNHPYKLEFIRADDIGQLCLVVRLGAIMKYVANTPALSEFYEGQSIKSPQALAKGVEASTVFVKKGLERLIDNRRVAHMIALSVCRMEYLGKLHKALDAQFSD